MIKTEDVISVLEPYHYDVMEASSEMFSLFENDLDDRDKYDLGRTWRNDWRAELKATLSDSNHTFCITSKFHDGSAIFGLTSIQSTSALIWLLQSKSFSHNASQFYGVSWPRRAHGMTKGVIDIFSKSYSPIFNFIPKRQKRNIRWLQNSGFSFFQDPNNETDMLLFGKGKGIEQMASDQKLWFAFTNHGPANE